MFWSSCFFFRCSCHADVSLLLELSVILEPLINIREMPDNRRSIVRLLNCVVSNSFMLFTALRRKWNRNVRVATREITHLTDWTDQGFLQRYGN